jgi:hypothetical protein
MQPLLNALPRREPEFTIGASTGVLEDLAQQGFAEIGRRGTVCCQPSPLPAASPGWIREGVFCFEDQNFRA